MARSAQCPSPRSKPGEVVLVRTGEKIPVDGVVVGGSAAVNQAPITGRKRAAGQNRGHASLRRNNRRIWCDRRARMGSAATRSFHHCLGRAPGRKAPVQKLADKVASWLIPVVLIFLVGVFLVTRDVSKVVTLLIFIAGRAGLATPLVMIACNRPRRAGVAF